MDSDDFPEGGGIGLDAGCGNTGARWSLPKTDIDGVPPNMELVAKGLGVETRRENAFLGGATFRPCG
jgi:hypothetical protein